MRKPKTTDTIYNGDRWRIPGSKAVYQALYRSVNGVPFWELYSIAKPGADPVYAFGGLESYFGAKFKTLYNQSRLKKIRTPLKDRTGPHILLWGLGH